MVSWTPKLFEIMALWALFRGPGPFCLEVLDHFFLRTFGVQTLSRPK